jgi:hypothetical protein
MQDPIILPPKLAVSHPKKVVIPPYDPNSKIPQSHIPNPQLVVRSPPAAVPLPHLSTRQPILYLWNTNTNLVHSAANIGTLFFACAVSPSQDVEDFKHIVAQFTISGIVEPPLKEFIHLLAQGTGSSCDLETYICQQRANGHIAAACSPCTGYGK